MKPASERQQKLVTPESWPRWAKTIAEASRITGITRASLHTYRKAGCEAFKANGKIDLHELRMWMDAFGKAAGPESSKLQAARIRLLTAQAHRVERENKRRDGETVARSEVIMGLGKILALTVSLLERAQQELPAAVKGCDERAVFRKFGERITEIKSELRLKFTALAEGKE